MTWNLASGISHNLEWNLINIISLIKSMQYKDISLDKDKYLGFNQYHTKDKDK